MQFHEKKIWFIWFHEFFCLDFFKFSVHMYIFHVHCEFWKKDQPTKSSNTYFSYFFCSSRLLNVITKWFNKFTNSSLVNLSSATKSRSGVLSLNLIVKHLSRWISTFPMVGSLERLLNVSETWPKVTSSMSSRLMEAFPEKVIMQNKRRKNDCRKSMYS